MKVSSRNFEIFRAVLSICKTKRVLCFPIPTLISKNIMSQIVQKVRKIPSYELKDCARLEISSSCKVLV